MLFNVQWEYKPAGKLREEHESFIRDEVRPIFHELAKRCAKEKILLPQVVYGYWPCNSDGRIP